MKNIVLALVLLFIFTNPAHARPDCGSYNLIERFLKKDYGEEPILNGILNNKKQLLRFFANKKTGTWSIVSINLNNYSCLIMYGDGLVSVVIGEQHAKK